MVDLDVPSSRIIFANPTKPIAHLNYAMGMGVETMTFDSEIELYKVHKFYPDAK